MTAAHYRLGVDVGGTFTDFVLMDEVTGKLTPYKVLTTYDDPANGIVEGIRELLKLANVAPTSVQTVVHGTTLATNAMLERKGAKTALLTTRGFRDVLEMGSEARYDIYDLFQKCPEPLVPRELRVEADERTSSSGAELQSINTAQVTAQTRWLLSKGVKAIGVVLLHSYANPRHEQEIAEIIRSVDSSVSLSLSHQVAPELGEYERMSTTTANAYIAPIMSHYLAHLERRLASLGISGRLYIMLSSGGLATAATAASLPIRLLESGPAGGVLAAAYTAKQSSAQRMLAFDMGGTTAKMCAIQSGQPSYTSVLEVARLHRFKPGSGLPIRGTSIDLLEISGGGGSIARVDTLGLLKVGPDSAGSEPGPACYGRGGLDPTVTDAAVVLGYLSPDTFLGGRLTLDTEAATRAIEQQIAKPLGMSIPEAAWGIYSVVTESMASATRMYSVERGLDPQAHTLLASGGAGPVHVARLAKILRMSEVICPPGAGVNSAFGFLVTPPSFDESRSVPGLLHELDLQRVNAALAEMDAQTRAHLYEIGVPEEKVATVCYADMSLIGQAHTIRVPVPANKLDEAALQSLEKEFHVQYRRNYAHEAPSGFAIHVLTWRVTANEVREWIGSGRPEQAGAVTGGHNQPRAWRSAYFPEAGGYVKTPIYRRKDFRPYVVDIGPAIVEEAESTAVIGPGQQFQVDSQGNLIIRTAERRSAGDQAEASMSDPSSSGPLSIDPALLEVLWQRMIAIADEGWSTLRRTSFSPIINEAFDMTCEVMDADGNSLASASRGMPVFNMCLPNVVRSFLNSFGAESIAEGDVFITNDPWLCAGHLPDVAVVTPVFHRHRLVGFIGTTANATDFGGTLARSAAREVYEEGLYLPLLRLVKKGTINEDLVAIIRANVRQSDAVIGDIYAQMTANAMAAKRLLDFMDEYQFAHLTGLSQTIASYSERGMRKAIDQVPDGVYRATVDLDGTESSLSLEVAITVMGSDMTIEFPNCPDQVDRGGINVTMTYTTAHTNYAMKSILASNIPNNEGSFRPITVRAREGSLLNTRHPASVGLRAKTGWYIHPLICKALAEVLPDKVVAPGGFTSWMVVSGYDVQGREFREHIVTNAGLGASKAGDGQSTTSYPTMGAAVPVEVIETRSPLLVEAKELINDSGGTGRHRGGLGQRIILRPLPGAGVKSVVVSASLHRTTAPASGLNGGTAGRLSRFNLRKADRSETDIPSGHAVLQSDQEAVVVELSGGGGFGDQRERAMEAVRRDRERGYVAD